MPRYGIQVPDRQLACVPVRSPEGQAYLGGDGGRGQLRASQPPSAHRSDPRVFEQETGHPLDLFTTCRTTSRSSRCTRSTAASAPCVCHRKGATRSLPPDIPTYPPISRGRSAGADPGLDGHRVLRAHRCPGSGAFHSTCHGAGRTMSRHAAKRRIRGPRCAPSSRPAGSRFVHDRSRSSRRRRRSPTRTSMTWSEPVSRRAVRTGRSSPSYRSRERLITRRSSRDTAIEPSERANAQIREAKHPSATTHGSQERPPALCRWIRPTCRPLSRAAPLRGDAPENVDHVDDLFEQRHQERLVAVPLELDRERLRHGLLRPANESTSARAASSRHSTLVGPQASMIRSAVWGTTRWPIAGEPLSFIVDMIPWSRKPIRQIRTSGYREPG